MRFLFKFMFLTRIKARVLRVTIQKPKMADTVGAGNFLRGSLVENNL